VCPLWVGVHFTLQAAETGHRGAPWTARATPGRTATQQTRRRGGVLPGAEVPAIPGDFRGDGHPGPPSGGSRHGVPRFRHRPPWGPPPHRRDARAGAGHGRRETREAHGLDGEGGGGHAPPGNAHAARQGHQDGLQGDSEMCELLLRVYREEPAAPAGARQVQAGGAIDNGRET